MEQSYPNFLGLDSQPSFQDCRTVVFPCPYEKTTSYLKGTQRGPLAILEASEQVEFFDAETGTEACELGIHTYPPFDYSGDDEEGLLQLTEEKMTAAFNEKKFVITLGGEHSLSIAPIRAAAKAYGPKNVSVLHLDAHSDMRDSYMGNKYSHASIMRRAHEVIERSYSVGIRAQCAEERAYLQQNEDRFGVLYDHDRAKSGLSLALALQYLKTDFVYLTIDLDYFSPSEVPSVGTPVPGGGSWYETLHFLRSVFSEKTIIGADVVELNPNGEVRSSFLAAQLVYKLITYDFINISK